MASKNKNKRRANTNLLKEMLLNSRKVTDVKKEPITKAPIPKKNVSHFARRGVERMQRAAVNRSELKKSSRISNKELKHFILGITGNEPINKQQLRSFVDIISQPQTVEEMLIALQVPGSPMHTQMMNMLFKGLELEVILEKLLERFVIENQQIAKSEREAFFATLEASVIKEAKEREILQIKVEKELKKEEKLPEKNLPKDNVLEELATLIKKLHTNIRNIEHETMIVGKKINKLEKDIRKLEVIINPIKEKWLQHEKFVVQEICNELIKKPPKFKFKLNLEDLQSIELDLSSPDTARIIAETCRPSSPIDEGRINPEGAKAKLLIDADPYQSDFVEKRDTVNSQLKLYFALKELVTQARLDAGVYIKSEKSTYQDLMSIGEFIQLITDNTKVVEELILRLKVIKASSYAENHMDNYNQMMALAVKYFDKKRELAKVDTTYAELREKLRIAEENFKDVEWLKENMENPEFKKSFKDLQAYDYKQIQDAQAASGMKQHFTALELLQQELTEILRGTDKFFDMSKKEFDDLALRNEDKRIGDIVVSGNKWIIGANGLDKKEQEELLDGIVDLLVKSYRNENVDQEVKRNYEKLNVITQKMEAQRTAEKERYQAEWTIANQGKKN